MEEPEGLEKAQYDLTFRPYWVELQQQFTDDELKLFQYHWARIISQFKDDIIPTEELQVVDLIKLELLMNRALKHNKREYRTDFCPRSPHISREAGRSRSGRSRRIQHGASGGVSESFTGISQQRLQRLADQEELDAKRDEGNKRATCETIRR